MKIKPFELERYFAKYEFTAPYLLSCSDCEPLTLKEVLSLSDSQTLRMWNNLWLGYTNSQGHPQLREEVSKLYTKIKPQEVLIVAPQEGILIAMNVLLEKGNHVIVTYPGYQSLYEIAGSIGCQLTKWQPDEKGGWDFDIDFLKSNIRKNTKLIVINFPHNPTGSLASKEKFKEVLEIAKSRGIYVFSDEMYRFLEYDKKDTLPSACDLYENAISLFGMSKTFGLPGLRIGWLTTKNKQLFKELTLFRDYTTICSSAPSEILALMALRAKEKIIERNLKIIKTNLKLLDTFFEKHSSILTWNRPIAGSIGFPRFLGKQSTTKFCQDLVNKKGVMLLPSYVYGYDQKHFRLGFGRKNMSQALKKLQEFLSA